MQCLLIGFCKTHFKAYNYRWEAEVDAVCWCLTASVCLWQGLFDSILKHCASAAFSRLSFLSHLVKNQARGKMVQWEVLWNESNYSALSDFLFFSLSVHTSVCLFNPLSATTFPSSSSSLSFSSQPRWLGEFHWVTGRPGSSWWLGGPPQMGSVSRGRWRRGVWGALAPTNGMASWAWLLAAVLLSLLTVSVARPPLTATKEEEATLEPEGKQQGSGRPGRWSRAKSHLFGLFLESRCRSVKFVSPP